MSRYTPQQKAAYYRKIGSQGGIVQYKKKSVSRKKAVSKPKASKAVSSKPRGSKYSQAASLAGGLVGSYIGGPAGGYLGQAVGGAAADIFKSITGIGDYKVVHNTLVNPSDSVPMFKNGKRITLVEHREYIQDIVTSATPGAFNIDSFEINPGLASTFPWLAEVAENYEQYRIHGMVFQFKSQSADALNSVNTALGTVIMATQYNMLNPSFANKQQMENYEFGCSSRPSCDLLHPIECDPRQTTCDGLFSVRLGGNISGDRRLYDIGRFSIATVGMQGASVNIGELWCTYQVELLKPRLGDSADLADHFQFINPVDATNYFGVPLPSAPTSSSDFGVVITDTTITIPPTYTGNILVAYYVIGDNGTWIDPAITPSLGASALNLIDLNTLNGFQSNYLALETKIKFMDFFKCVNGGLLTFSLGTLPTNVGGTCHGDLFVISVPSTLTN